MLKNALPKIEEENLNICTIISNYIPNLQNYFLESYQNFHYLEPMNFSGNTEFQFPLTESLDFSDFFCKFDKISQYSIEHDTPQNENNQSSNKTNGKIFKNIINNKIDFSNNSISQGNFSQNDYLSNIFNLSTNREKSNNQNLEIKNSLSQEDNINSIEDLTKNFLNEQSFVSKTLDTNQNSYIEKDYDETGYTSLNYKKEILFSIFKNVQEFNFLNVQVEEISDKFINYKRETRIKQTDSIDKKINVKLRKKLQEIVDYFLNIYNKKNNKNCKKFLKILIKDLNLNLNICGLKKLHNMKISDIILEYSKIFNKEKKEKLFEFLKFIKKLSFENEVFLNLTFEEFLKIYYKKYLINDLNEIILYNDQELLKIMIQRIKIRKNFSSEKNIYGNIYLKRKTKSSNNSSDFPIKNFEKNTI